jgi:hypothetical protein
MTAHILLDGSANAWLYALIAVSLGQFMSRWAWAAFFGIGTVVLAYRGALLMAPYAALFAMELTSKWLDENPIRVLLDVLRNKRPITALPWQPN